MERKNQEEGNTNKLPLVIDLNLPLVDEKYGGDHLINQEAGYGLNPTPDHCNSLLYVDPCTQPTTPPRLLDLIPPSVELEVHPQLPPLFDLPPQFSAFNIAHSVSDGRRDNRPLGVRTTSNKRRNPTQKPKDPRKPDTVNVPYPWATNLRAKVQTMNYLISNNIKYITGALECKSCTRRYEEKYNLLEKFSEVAGFLIRNKADMHDRAPEQWTNPTYPSCKYCKGNESVRPVISDKKREINWLFLFLSQFIGYCRLSALRYFCKYSKIHRTGAKNRLIYLTYLGLCEQLDPVGLYDVN